MVSYDLCSFFFFSSRRRHTRFDCDWSSDVCSSDLAHGAGTGWARSLLAQHLSERRRAPGRGCVVARPARRGRSEEHTSELQSQSNLVCRLLLEKKKTKQQYGA